MSMEKGSGSDSFSNRDGKGLVNRNKSRKKIRRKFSPQEDELLRYAVKRLGSNNWQEVSVLLKTRSQRQCRDRWNNYLSPGSDLSQWTNEEDELLSRMVSIYGHHWSLITKNIPGRTPASIRNRHIRLERSKNRQAAALAISSGGSTAQPASNFTQYLGMSLTVPGVQPVASSPSIPELDQDNNHGATKVTLPSINNFIRSYKK